MAMPGRVPAPAGWRQGLGRFRPKPSSRSFAATACWGEPDTLAVRPGDSSGHSFPLGARPAADSGYPPDGLTSLGGSVCVGVGRGSGGRSGRSGCRWIGAPRSCRWRSSGREDMWVVGALGAGSGTLPRIECRGPAAPTIGWPGACTKPLRYGPTPRQPVTLRSPLTIVDQY